MINLNNACACNCVGAYDDVLIEEIECPKLNQVEFASDLEKAFANINNNFARLANHDFIKGDSNSLVEIKSIPIFGDSDEPTEKICIELKEYISSLLGDQPQYIADSGFVFNYFDNFTKETAGSLHVIYANDETSVIAERIPYSSLYYIFLDGRFWNASVGKINPAAYYDIQDMSCVIVYDRNNGFKIVSNALPTIYYESGVGLCWNINGKNTGIAIQGIPGQDGKSAYIQIVKVDTLSDTHVDNVKTGKVVAIFENEIGYMPIETVSDIRKYDSTTSLVMENSTNSIYFGYTNIQTTENTISLHVNCDSSINLNTYTTAGAILEVFKNIKLMQNESDVSLLRGLLLPINYNERQSIHFASSISPFENSISSSNDVNIVPLKDINDLYKYNDTSLVLDRYLYISVNPDSNAISKNDSIKETLSRFDYNLTYKLIDTVLSLDDSRLKPTDASFITLNTVSDGEVELNVDNTKYIKDVLNGNYTTTVNYGDSLKHDFGTGPLYVWELYSDIATDIPDHFKYVYTDSISPSLSTNLYWFNALETVIVNDSDKEYDKYIVPGWFNIFNVLNIDKFVPVYKNVDTILSDDTSINMHHNVNITGHNTDGKSKKNLTVNGDINCDNVYVNGCAKINSIDISSAIINSDIIGTEGISLAKYNYIDNGISKSDYRIKMTSDGDIETLGNIVAANAKLESINSDEIYAENVSSTNMTIIGDSISEDPLKMNIELTDNESAIYDDRLDINVVDLKSIDIKKRNVIDTGVISNGKNDIYEIELKGNVSKISTDTPVIAYNKSSIVVTDDSVENVFIDENVNNDLYNAISDYASDLIDSPNKYEVNKHVLEFDLTKTPTEYRPIEVNSNQMIEQGDIEIYASNVELSKAQSFLFNRDGAKVELSQMTICKFDISKSYRSSLIDMGSYIKMILPKMKFALGLQSTTNNGKSTILKNMKMTLKCDIFSVLDDYERLIYTYNCGTYNLHDSNIILNEENAHYSVDDYQFKSFVVNPHNINITNNDVLKEIYDSYKGNECISFRIYPEFEINIDSEDNTYNLAGNCKILNVIPVGHSNKSKSIIESDDLNQTVMADIYSKLIYKEINETDSLKNSTVICKDGVLIKGASDNNGYVFGIGMGKHNDTYVPELHYQSYNKETKEKVYKSISLIELFNKL